MLVYDRCEALGFIARQLKPPPAGSITIATLVPIAYRHLKGRRL